MNELQREILTKFVDSSNRPKKTPIHESAIQVMFEDKYSMWKVNYGLEKLEKFGYITSITEIIKNTGKAKFYFATKLEEKLNHDKIIKKIKRSAYWINRYSNPKITKMLGNHLHSLVANVLRTHGFKLVDGKDFQKFQNKRWDISKDSLDIIATNTERKLEVGVEIKNMLYLIPKDELVRKIKMCETLGLTPIFACRWLEPYKKEITKRGGLAWQFKYQIYPFGQEKFVEIIRKRFHFPVKVSGELPNESTLTFESWLDSREA